MSKIEFGVKTGQSGYSYDQLETIWTKAEELGFDSAWLYDHFYALGNKNDPCLECWTTLAALAAATRRLSIGTMVTAVSYRHPSLLAKMGTTVDIVSNGRLILGMGAGWYEEEYRAYGYEFPDQATRVKQLKEALIVIRKLWTEEKTTFNGDYYKLHDALSFPKPLQKPTPKIFVGMSKGKRTLPYLAVRYADGFNLVSGSREDITTILESINAYCEKYSRKFSDLLASWQGFITIGRTEADVRAIVERAAGERRQTVPEFMRTGEERGYVIGTPESCVERLRGLRDLGFNHFMLIFSDDTSLTPLELFRDEVIPNLK